MSIPSKVLPVIALLVLALAACGKGEAPKPPERATPVTLGTVAKKDLPVIESAVGAESGIGAALDYDPTRVAAGTYYIRVSFPEHVATRLRGGQPVRLASFAEPNRMVSGQIREIRPSLNITTRSREVIVAVTNAGDWRPAGSVRADVVMGVRHGALVVPEQSIVLRPAGGGSLAATSVVYLVDGETARERKVRTGIVHEGNIEILEGVRAGETVVVDGAGMLTDGAKIKARDVTK